MWGVIHTPANHGRYAACLRGAVATAPRGATPVPRPHASRLWGAANAAPWGRRLPLPVPTPSACWQKGALLPGGSGGRGGNGYMTIYTTPPHPYFHAVLGSPAAAEVAHGEPGAMPFPAFTEWRAAATGEEDREVDSILVEAASRQRRECRRRFRAAGWDPVVGFLDVPTAGKSDFHLVPIREVHGDPDAGQQGGHRTTVEVMAFANEVLREGRAKGVMPWLRLLYRWAVRHHNRTTSTPLLTAANAFGRARRDLGPAGVIVDDDQVIRGLDYPFAPDEAAAQDLVALSALVEGSRQDCFDEGASLDFDALWRSGDLLTPTERPSRTQRPRAYLLARGRMGPSYAAWMALPPIGNPLALVPLPEALIDTGLRSTPPPPRVLDYVYSLVEDASDALWRTVLVETVVSLAVHWYDALSRRNVLLRTSPRLLAMFAQLRGDNLNRGGTDPACALGFTYCVEGARVFPWAAVTQYVGARTAGAPSVVGVAYTGGAPYGFTALEPLEAFPSEVLAPDRYAPRLSPESDVQLVSGSPSHLSGAASGVGGGGSPPTPPWVRAVRQARREAVAASQPQASLRQEQARAAAALRRAADVRAARAALEAQRDQARRQRAPARSSSPVRPGRVDRVNAERVAAARRRFAPQRTADARVPSPRADARQEGGSGPSGAKATASGGSNPLPPPGEGGGSGAATPPAATSRSSARVSPKPASRPRSAGGCSSRPAGRSGSGAGNSHTSTWRSGSGGGRASSRSCSAGASSSPPWMDADAPPPDKGSGNTLRPPSGHPRGAAYPRTGYAGAPPDHSAGTGGAGDAAGARRAAAEAARRAGEEAREGRRLREERAASDARWAAALAEARRAAADAEARRQRAEAVAARATAEAEGHRAAAEAERRASRGTGGPPPRWFSEGGGWGGGIRGEADAPHRGHPPGVPRGRDRGAPYWAARGGGESPPRATGRVPSPPPWWESRRGSPPARGGGGSRGSRSAPRGKRGRGESSPPLRSPPSRRASKSRREGSPFTAGDGGMDRRSSVPPSRGGVGVPPHLISIEEEEAALLLVFRREDVDQLRLLRAPRGTLTVALARMVAALGDRAVSAARMADGELPVDALPLLAGVVRDGLSRTNRYQCFRGVLEPLLSRGRREAADPFRASSLVHEEGRPG